MTITGGVRPFIAALFLLAYAGSSSAQVASSLLNDEEPLGPPGDIVGTIGNPAVNHAGGFTVGLSTVGSATLSHVWGSPDGVAAPVLLRTEGTFGPLVQTSYESFYGISNAGQVGYSASGTGGPDGAFDSVWVDDTPVAVEGDPLPAGPLQDLFWSFASRPSITAGGLIHFQGGTRVTVGGTTTARGLFDNTGTPLLYTGDAVPGLPAVLDDTGTPISVDYRVSASATNYIVEVEMETVGTGLTTSDDGAVVFSGSALMAGGSIVREAQPVPAAIGGEPGENWDNFDFMGVTEAGQYLFTGDTDAATTIDEIVVVDGMIVAREGQLLDGLAISGAIEGAYMNENGDWAVTWDYNDPVEGNREALFLNGELVIKELDEVDFDGDGVVDAGAILNDFSGISTLVVGDRAGGEVSIYFTALVNDNGAGNLEGFYRINVPIGPGADGDLSLDVSDTPDPVTTVGDPITYAVTVRNLSPNPATNVVVTSTLDANVVFNAAASDPIAIHDGSPMGGVVTSTIGNMAADEIQVFNIVVDTTQVGTVTTTHVVSGNEPDPIPDNNTVVSTTDVVILADLAVSISDDPDPVVTPGGSLTYTVGVSNLGPSAATGVSVTMNLDATTIFNAGASDPIAIHDGSPTGGVVTAAIGSLASGANTSFDVVVNVTVQGTLTADATVTGNEPDPDSANNFDVEETLFELSADVAIDLTDSPDPVVGVGGQIEYVVNVSNAGPSDAAAVVATVNLDPTTTFVSAGAPAMHSGGVVTAELGAMAAGANASFSILVETTAAGRVVVTGAAQNSGPQSDPDLGNNDTVVNTLVLSDLSCAPIGIFSDLVESPTSNVPGVPGAKFTSFSRPYRSPDGTYWIITSDTDLPTTQDNVVIVKKQGQPAEVAVQEGVTTLDLGDLVGLVDQHLSINDSGQFAFATNTNAATNSDETIVKWDGLSFVTVAREGEPAAVDNYGSILATANIVVDGTVWFDADTTGATGFDRIIVSNDGATIVLREGTDIPANQDGGAMFAWDNFDSNDLFVDSTGANYVLTGDTENTDTSTDDIFALNNGVVVQEGVILPGSGYTSPADTPTPVEYGSITGAGNWLARGDNDDGQDWVVLNGALIAEKGAPIVAGSPELFDDAPFAAGFFAFAANNTGDVLVGGTTNAGENAANAVLVLNATQVIAREDDPIDIDGNGIFDDGVRIRTIGNDDIIVTEDQKVIFVVTLRADGADGSAPSIGDALVMVDPLCLEPSPCGNGVPDPGEECDDGNDANCDGCSIDCTVEVGIVCGDGIPNATCGEQCDAGGESSTCDDDCTIVECGDGNSNTTAGEECDDGGESSTCDDDCTAVECGDGNSNTTAGEECDDGNNVTCDGCSAICEHEIGFECGDGGLNTECGEECDDGNNQDGDGCASDCTLEAPVPAVSHRGVLALVVLLVMISTAVLLWRRRLEV